MTKGFLDDLPADELRQARRSIASLISKSEKAHLKLAPATWQHKMLHDNLQALHIASALMDEETRDGADFSSSDLDEALQAFASMILKTETALAKFSRGMSQHTLLSNRLKALRLAEALVKAELAR